MRRLGVGGCLLALSRDDAFKAYPAGVLEDARAVVRQMLVVCDRVPGARQHLG